MRRMRESVAAPHDVVYGRDLEHGDVVLGMVLNDAECNTYDWGNPWRVVGWSSDGGVQCESGTDYQGNPLGVKNIQKLCGPNDRVMREARAAPLASTAAAARMRKVSDFPHRCPRCAQPSYNGLSVEHWDPRRDATCR